jgi:carbon storage regulator
MLVLSRQRDETIMIGDEIEITVVDIRGDKVRIGIAAPSHVAVHRKEIYEAIRAENRQAASLAKDDLSSLRRGVSSEARKEDSGAVPIVRVMPGAGKARRESA